MPLFALLDRSGVGFLTVSAQAMRRSVRRGLLGVGCGHTPFMSAWLRRIWAKLMRRDGAQKATTPRKMEGEETGWHEQDKTLDGRYPYPPTSRL